MYKIKKNNLKSIIIHPNSKIRDAIKKLSKTGLQILIVCNNKGQITGTITDGDIRRGLLRKISLDANIINIYNKKPFYLKEDLNDSIINFILRNKALSHVPLVDKKLKLKSLYS